MIVWLGNIALSIAFIPVLYGWGSILQKLRPATNTITNGFGWQCLDGIALLLSLGGFLNLVGWANQLVLGAIWAAGIGLVGWQIGRWGLGSLRANSSSQGSDPVGPKFSLIWLIAGLLAAINLVAFCWFLRFHVQDDVRAYLTLAERLRQTGTLGLDPFNEHRVATTLGGGSFLLALLGTFFSIEGLVSLDGGIMPVLMGLVIRSWLLKRFGSKKADWLALVLTLSLAVPAIRANSSPCLIGTGLLLQLFLSILSGTAISSAGEAVCTGLLIGGICSLKTNLIPTPGLLFLFLFIQAIRQPSTGARWKLPSFLAFGLAVAVVPWMVSLHNSSATFLFPLLGRGVHKSAYAQDIMGSFSTGNLRMVWKAAMNPVLLVLGAVCLLTRVWKWPRREAEAGIAIAISAVIGCLMVTVGAAGFEPMRYTSGFLLAAVVALLMAMPALVGNKNLLAPLPKVALTGLALAVLFVCKWHGVNLAADIRNQLKWASNGRRFEVPGVRQKYRRVLADVTPDTQVLAFVTQPWLLPFDQNELWVITNPGGAGPAPGVPNTSDPEVLRTYLSHCGVKCLMFSRSLSNLVNHMREIGRQKGVPLIADEIQRYIGFYDASMQLIDLNQSPYSITNDTVLIRLSPN